jgi:ABC-2 type transport system permease protein
MSYFIEAVRTVFIRGGGISSIWHQLLVLLGIGSIMATWAVISYKKNS